MGRPSEIRSRDSTVASVCCRCRTSLVNATTGAITVNRNIVRGVNPAGQIWVIDDLKADVSIDGHIRVKGRGLLLGGGNAIGTERRPERVRHAHL